MKTKKIVGRARELNPGPQELESDVETTQPRRSVTRHEITFTSWKHFLFVTNQKTW
jgi:hypothetical protein